MDDEDIQYLGLVDHRFRERFSLHLQRRIKPSRSTNPFFVFHSNPQISTQKKIPF